MIKTSLCQLLGIEYPIIQGGMAWAADASLAAAVANGGGLGLISAMNSGPDWLRKEIAKVRELTEKPFGVNLMLLGPFTNEVARVVIEEGVKYVTTGAGSPGPYLDQWKAAGSIVIPVVSTLTLALRMERQGADAVIAEGQEAGGHVGEMTSMVLWPLLADRLSIPMIAAGGIAGPRQILAARALGAEGFQLGTLFLSAEECPIHDNYKAAVLKASDTQVAVMGRQGGVPCRVMKNQLYRDYLAAERQGADRPTLEGMLTGSLRQAVLEGDPVRGAYMMGLAAAQISEVKPLSKLLADLFQGLDPADPGRA